MKLYLVRHGETDWLLEGRLQGRSGVELNATGRRQAQAAADYLKSLQPARLYASELKRALETALYISGACGLPLKEDARLNEIFFGEWEGRPHGEIRDKFPDLYREWIELKSDFRAPGGESVQLVAERIRSFFGDCSKAAETVIAVSHGGPIRLLLLELLGQPLHKFRLLPVDPGSVILVENGSGPFRSVKIHVETGAGTPLENFLNGGPDAGQA